jgi:hypothetical protein
MFGGIMKQSLLILLCSALLTVLFAPKIIQAEEIVNEVFLLVRENKLLGFSGLRNSWSEKDLRPGETIIKSMYDGNVAVAYTTDRALGFSGITGRWTEKRFRIRESVTSISAKGDIATVITDIRALAFSAKTGNWIETQFNINN